MIDILKTLAKDYWGAIRQLIELKGGKKAEEEEEEEEMVLLLNGNRLQGAEGM